ncbi:hypothetical protein GCM10009111_09140 [Colwellia asteriadis]|uniref:OmpR/PhoB-type domain-containing protein n=1 Tax=Colwellia asteriadis TaxID=517723 RepID=A0ABN1L4N5_9GAMM
MQYQIGPWLFLPARCVISSSLIEKELDPLTFKLITYFISQPDRIIPRQELVEKVWQQNFVDDNAINRAISELRKQLSHPEHKAPLIKTHYRKGYSLTVTPQLLQEEQEPAQTPVTQAINDTNLTENKATDIIEPHTVEVAENNVLLDNVTTSSPAIPSNNTQTKKPSPYKWLLILVVLLLVVNIFIDFKQLNEQPSLNNSEKANNASESTFSEQKKLKEPIEKLISKAENVSFTAATWNIGAETLPLVSPDKNFLAYTNKSEGITSTFIKHLLTKKEIKLSYKNLYISAMSWQPQNQVLLTEISDFKSTCHYATFNLSDINNVPEPTLIKACDKQARGMAQLSAKGNNMFYLELDDKQLGQEINQYNIQTQKNTVLVPSGDAQYGVARMIISPNGRYLLYQWHERNNPAKLYLFDLTTREQNLLYEQEKELDYMTFAWLPDSEHIGVLKGRNLHFINIKNKNSKIIELPLEQYLSHIDFLDNNQFFSSQAGSNQMQIARVDNIFRENEPNVTILNSSDSNDYYPIYSKKEPNLRYFISSRTNQYQIWQANGSEERQISHFDAKEQQALYVLMLSDNENYLLFSRNNQLEFIDLKTGKLHEIPELKQAKASSYLWTNNDQSIVYSTIQDKVSQIWQFNLVTRNKTQLTFEGGQKLLKNDSGDIFYINNNNLLSLSYEKNKSTANAFKKKLTITPAQCWCSVTLQGDYFYSLSDPLFLARMHLFSDEKQYLPLPRASMGITMPTPNTLLTTLFKENNTQIQRIFWSTTTLP